MEEGASSGCYLGSQNYQVWRCVCYYTRLFLAVIQPVLIDASYHQIINNVAQSCGIDEVPLGQCKEDLQLS